jgi:hypothetical protein
MPQVLPVSDDAVPALLRDPPPTPAGAGAGDEVECALLGELGDAVQVRTCSGCTTPMQQMCSVDSLAAGCYYRHAHLQSQFSSLQSQSRNCNGATATAWLQCECRRAARIGAPRPAFTGIGRGCAGAQPLAGL